MGEIGACILKLLGNHVEFVFFFFYHAIQVLVEFASWLELSFKLTHHLLVVHVHFLIMQIVLSQLYEGIEAIAHSQGLILVLGIINKLHLAFAFGSILARSLFEVRIIGILFICLLSLSFSFCLLNLFQLVFKIEWLTLTLMDELDRILWFGPHLAGGLRGVVLIGLHIWI